MLLSQNEERLLIKTIIPLNSKEEIVKTIPGLTSEIPEIDKDKKLLSRELSEQQLLLLLGVNFQNGSTLSFTFYNVDNKNKAVFGS